MRISIAERFRPFTHLSGQLIPIPHTLLQARIFPVCLQIDTVGELTFDLTGPVDGFTAMLDLESSTLKVFGQAKQGYFRYRIEASERGLLCVAERLPKEGISYTGLKSGVWKEKEAIVLSNTPFQTDFKQERLSFGVTKQLDMADVLRRNLPEEQLPCLFALGQKIPQSMAEGGALRWLQEIDSYEGMQSFLKCCFEGVFSPLPEGARFCGIPLPPFSGHALAVLPALYNHIRRYLLLESPHELHILNRNMGRLPHGRLLTTDLSLEWAKGLPRRMIYTPCATAEITLHFHKSVKTFRLRTDNKSAGETHPNGAALLFHDNQKYYFDHFMK